MDQPVIAFTAVYLKGKHGYVGFVEELPGVNSHGKSLDEARENLRRVAAVIFDEERALSAELLNSRDVVREDFRISIART
jgi:predicted RNase H-like HicB family nuclease